MSFNLSLQATEIAQTVLFAKKAMNITEISNPITVSLQLAKIIAFECLSPQIRFSLKCVVLGIQLAIVFTGTGPVSTAGGVALFATANQIAEAIKNAK